MDFFTYLMLCVEFALFSILPHMLGKTIDALLAGSRQQFYMYLLASVAACIIGTARRRLDTRVFMQVWVDKSLDSIKDLLNRGIRKSFILSGNDDFDQLEQDYNGLRDKYIQKSDLDAYCWRWVEVLSIIASVIAIFALVDSKQSAGTIMSSLMYTGKLFEKAGVLSFFFNHWKQIKMVDDVLRKP